MGAELCQAQVNFILFDFIVNVHSLIERIKLDQVDVYMDEQNYQIVKREKQDST